MKTSKTPIGPDGIPVGRRYTCPFCSALIVLNDEYQETHHAAPICEGWAKACAASGGKRVHLPGIA